MSNRHYRIVGGRRRYARSYIVQSQAASARGDGYGPRQPDEDIEDDDEPRSVARFVKPLVCLKVLMVEFIEIAMAPSLERLEQKMETMTTNQQILQTMPITTLTHIHTLSLTKRGILARNEGPTISSLHLSLTRLCAG